MPSHPARRPTPAVYRRRRLAVLAVLVLLIAAVGGGIWLAYAQPWQTASGPTQSAQPDPSGTKDASGADGAAASPEASSSPDPEETPEIVACVAKDVDVKAVTDAGAYGTSQLPQLSISLENISGTDCTINVGSSTQEFTISSGADVWWRSTDCQTEPSDMIVTLKAGAKVSSVTPVVWDRTRSSVGTCDQKNRPRAPGGGASYHLAVAIGGFESAMTKQIILR